MWPCTKSHARKVKLNQRVATVDAQIARTQAYIEVETKINQKCTETKNDEGVRISSVKLGEFYTDIGNQLKLKKKIVKKIKGYGDEEGTNQVSGEVSAKNITVLAGQLRSLDLPSNILIQGKKAAAEKKSKGRKAVEAKRTAAQASTSAQSADKKHKVKPPQPKRREPVAGLFSACSTAAGPSTCSPRAGSSGCTPTGSSTSIEALPIPKSRGLPTLILEFTAEKVAQIVSDYFTENPPESTASGEAPLENNNASNSSTSLSKEWNPKSILGEEMSPIFDPTHGFVPEALPPLSEGWSEIHPNAITFKDLMTLLNYDGKAPLSLKHDKLELTLCERYFLAQTFHTLLKFAATITDTAHLIHTWNALKVKLQVENYHPAGPPSTFTQENVLLLDLILDKIDQDHDHQRSTYRLEMIRDVIVKYEEYSQIIHTEDLDISYVVEKCLAVAGAHNTSEFSQRKFRVLMELQEWNDRVGAAIHGGKYYDIIGVSFKSYRQEPTSGGDGDE